MSNFVLIAQERANDQQGKGSSRRLRHAAQVPAIIYGGDATPVAITLELRQLVRLLQEDAFFTDVISITIGDKTESVKIQALQRHPSKETPMHADFKRV